MPRALYFFRCGDSVKIGSTIDPIRRLKELQSSAPEPLQVLAIFTEDGDKEGYCHKALRASRIHREWFRYGDEVLALIAQIPSLPSRIPKNNRFTHGSLGNIIDGSTYSIAEIADHMEVTVAMVYYWRAGTSLPAVPRFAKLCKFLGVKMEGVKIA